MTNQKLNPRPHVNVKNIDQGAIAKDVPKRWVSYVS